jgi:hypothetical protein
MTTSKAKTAISPANRAHLRHGMVDARTICRPAERPRLSRSDGVFDKEVSEMDLKRKLIAGVIALAVGNCFALPTSARADSDDWHRHDHHEWR